MELNMKIIRSGDKEQPTRLKSDSGQSSECIQFRATESESGLFDDDNNSLMDSIDKDDIMGQSNVLLISDRSNQIELESSESERSDEELIMDLHAPKGKMIRASHNSSSWWPISTLKENL